MSLTEHSLVIRESSDDKIHLQYHPTISEKENLQHSIKEKTLEISDTKSTTRRSVGSSIEGILFSPQVNSQVAIMKSFYHYQKEEN